MHLRLFVDRASVRTLGTAVRAGVVLCVLWPGEAHSEQRRELMAPVTHPAA